MICLYLKVKGRKVYTGYEHTLWPQIKGTPSFQTQPQPLLIYISVQWRLYFSAFGACATPSDERNWPFYIKFAKAQPPQKNPRDATVGVCCVCLLLSNSSAFSAPSHSKAAIKPPSPPTEKLDALIHGDGAYPKSLKIVRSARCGVWICGLGWVAGCRGNL